MIGSADQATTLDLFRAGTSFAAVFIAGLGLLIARKQLSNVARSLRLNGTLAIVQLESEIQRRRERVEERLAAIVELGNASSPSKRSAADRKAIDLHGVRLNSEVEGYLNAVDRLCFCILNGYVDERDWRAEYREFIANEMKTHKDYFEPGTRYVNITRLHDQWKGT